MDVKGKYIFFIFIDGYVYIELLMVIFKEFLKFFVFRGVIIVVMDFYEIVNVLGKSGIEFMF